MVRRVQTVPTIDTALVATGDVVIDVQTIVDMNPSSGNNPKLERILGIEEGGQVPGLMFVFFKSLPTGTYTKNANPVFSDADKLAITGIAEIDGIEWAIMGGISLGDFGPFDQTHMCDDNGKVYWIAIARSQYDATGADDLKLTFIYRTKQ